MIRDLLGCNHDCETHLFWPQTPLKSTVFKNRTLLYHQTNWNQQKVKNKSIKHIIDVFVLQWNQKNTADPVNLLFFVGSSDLAKGICINVYIPKRECYGWWKKLGVHQLRLAVDPIIYKVLFNPRWCTCFFLQLFQTTFNLPHMCQGLTSLCIMPVGNQRCLIINKS